MYSPAHPPRTGTEDDSRWAHKVDGLEGLTELSLIRYICMHVHSTESDCTLAASQDSADDCFTHISWSEGTNCNHILAAKACGTLCCTLSHSESSQEYVPYIHSSMHAHAQQILQYRTMLMTVEVLWNLLEFGSQLKVRREEVV